MLYEQFVKHFQYELDKIGYDPASDLPVRKGRPKKEQEVILSAEDVRRNERIMFLKDGLNDLRAKIDHLDTKNYHSSIVYWLKRIAPIDPSLFDTKPNLFHFTDGVFDFEEDKFREHRKFDYLTMSCGHKYPSHTAMCQKFMDYLCTGQKIILFKII